MSEDELSVRLEWPERSTVPFRPSTDETVDPSAPRPDEPIADRLARLELTVDSLHAEVARLRAQLARLKASPTPEPRGARSDASKRRASDRDKDQPRPIRVRPRPASRDAT